MGVIAILLQMAGPEGRELLAWDRSALASGELWRLVTGHFVHLGWSHLGLNLAGLALVTWITGGAYGLLRWTVIAVVTIAVIDAGFWYLYGNLDWYVGLSGLLHGLLAAGLLAGIRERDREALVLALLVTGKLVWEQTLGPLPGSESGAGGAVIVNAHLYGAVGGILGALIPWRRVRPEASI
jgi:rhomboid family GlyGly-CTERM serine protease